MSKPKSKTRRAAADLADDDRDDLETDASPEVDDESSEVVTPQADAAVAPETIEPEPRQMAPGDQPFPLNKPSPGSVLPGGDPHKVWIQK